MEVDGVYPLRVVVNVKYEGQVLNGKGGQFTLRLACKHELRRRLRTSSEAPKRMRCKFCDPIPKKAGS